MRAYGLMDGTPRHGQTKNSALLRSAGARPGGHGDTVLPGRDIGRFDTVGFDWWRNYVTQLFRPVAVNGAANGARPYAIAGMWVFCVGMAELFRQLAEGMASTWHGKWVRIFGIATMVYAALTVTRLHDLMVTIAAGFFVCAQVVLLDWLWRRRHRAEFMAGIINLALALMADLSTTAIR